MCRIVTIVSILFFLISCQEVRKESSVSAFVSNTIERSDTVSYTYLQEKIESLRYETMSRGAFFSIKVSADFIEKTEDRNKKDIGSKKCSKDDWATIQSSLNKIDLEKIHKLETPTDYKSVDRALHAKLIIRSSSKTYTSSSFDHGSPPKEIKQLVNTILSLGENIE
ncbi:hypothetical protein [Aquimarina pacifica]|uniref:hypothetical protein n=1 Tax=Aquimarina pacifica TaxID=1296415 RepID=UPI0004B87D2F|nr:hypothetical protein [Aquimarina pacifica]